MWFIDLFREPVIYLTLGLVGILILCIIAIIGCIIGGAIYEGMRFVLSKLKLIKEPYWMVMQRERKQREGNTNANL